MTVQENTLLLNPLKTSLKYTWAEVYGKDVLQHI